MSPRAAWRLEQLGFGPVHDYTGGKADWIAAGLPTEAPARKPRAGDVLRADVPTCGLDERAGAAAAKARAAGWDLVVVINDSRVVAGVLAADDVGPDEHRPAAELMRPGPTTIRADEDPDDARGRMAEQGVRHLVVTTPDGELLGILERYHHD